MSTHRCPAKGCVKRVPDRLLMCAVHWGRVSRPTQQAVYAHYQPGQSIATMSDAYRAAMNKAVAEANGEGGAA